MELYIAGGCREHGCNCFLIRGSRYYLLLDCGEGLGNTPQLPSLLKEDIEKIRYIFLSHSHRDHVGALSWLFRQGFSGRIYASAPTLDVIRNRDGLALQNSADITAMEDSCGEIRIDEGLYVSFGRSGHCRGALWYQFSFEDKRIFFSGDYKGESSCYPWDTPKDIYADAAIIDCAYGTEIMDPAEQLRALRKLMAECLREGRQLLLPAPYNGRGAELKLIADEMLRKMDIGSRTYDDMKKDHFGIMVLPDPQLKKKESRRLSEYVLSHGGKVVFTGHVYEDTEAFRLLKEGRAEMLRYPVHPDAREALKLCAANDFRKVVFNHCQKEIRPEDCLSAGKRLMKEMGRDEKEAEVLCSRIHPMKRGDSMIF